MIIIALLIFGFFFTGMGFLDMKTLPYEKHSLSKSVRSSRRHKHLYGVSLSSITGFEKPMIPPHIINYDLPTNTSGLMNLDLPSKFSSKDSDSDNFLIYPLQ